MTRAIVYVHHKSFIWINLPPKLQNFVNPKQAVNSLRLFIKLARRSGRMAKKIPRVAEVPTEISYVAGLCSCWCVILPSSFKKEGTRAVICREYRVKIGNCLKDDFD